MRNDWAKLVIDLWSLEERDGIQRGLEVDTIGRYYEGAGVGE